MKISISIYSHHSWLFFSNKLICIKILRKVNKEVHLLMCSNIWKSTCQACTKQWEQWLLLLIIITSFFCAFKTEGIGELFYREAPQVARAIIQEAALHSLLCWHCPVKRATSPGRQADDKPTFQDSMKRAINLSLCKGLGQPWKAAPYEWDEVGRSAERSNGRASIQPSGNRN